ncbi:Transcriptional regulator containing GAF, AAA-type ATPase, and DNA-binding Fis domains [Desulfocicer vacuolatum DSM 3385]|uniref:Transcriptional regulator containing GAF, AAA-type ATPase, and DNA-binding Fis domains n=1 Tax=Desulfocicer vacuolatum DSM 3385 TaxID=1121400 RepID=A0A1W2CYU8_9BACT|nr:sigma 54-interacting transcriptional regulator [Desulfocicer vacuolatum]SMC90485.1 Transcriptional regulator containing GAF, AAA-type ATPase, and DNA-binding Fis domains [Desulfocicer vacuolatum DSM 3385]
MAVNEKEFFSEATLKICGSLEIEKALHQCLLYIRKFIPVGQMGFHVYHPEPGIVETVAHATSSLYDAASIKNFLSKKGQKQVEDQRSLRIRVIDRLGDDPVTGPVAENFGASDLSGLVMDLVLEKTMLGVVSLFNNGKQKFNKEHVHLLSLLNKPCAIALTNSLRFRELEKIKELLIDDNKYFQKELNKFSGEKLIGAQRGLKKVMQMVQRVAPLESPVLLLGQTGTGKEVIANTIHNLSHRKNRPFIPVNCGAIPTSLLDSELFGYEKGAFTGAISKKRGRIERANGGTLFLDEIGELTPEAQVRLLRVLQEKEIDRLGGSETVRVNIRVIAATHQNLEKMMEKAQFREDLFFRLRVFPVTLPPLKNRREDIPDLIEYFIMKKSKEMKRTMMPAPSPDAIRRLMDYHWPGNIRELENAVERSLILDRGPLLFFKGIGEHPAEGPPPIPASCGVDMKKPLELNQVMAGHIQSVMNLCKGRVEGEKGAARILNIHPSTLRKKMKKLNIPFGRNLKN